MAVMTITGTSTSWPCKYVWPCKSVSVQGCYAFTVSCYRAIAVHPHLLMFIHVITFCSIIIKGITFFQLQPFPLWQSKNIYSRQVYSRSISTPPKEATCLLMPRSIIFLLVCVVCEVCQHRGGHAVLPSALWLLCVPVQRHVSLYSWRSRDQNQVFFTFCQMMQWQCVNMIWAAYSFIWCRHDLQMNSIASILQRHLSSQSGSGFLRN